MQDLAAARPPWCWASRVLRWVPWKRDRSTWPAQGESSARSDKPRPSLSPQPRHAAECRGRERSEGQAEDGSQLASRLDSTSLLPLLTALGTKETAFYQGILSLAHAVPVSIYVCSLPRSQGCVS